VPLWTGETGRRTEFLVTACEPRTDISQNTSVAGRRYVEADAARRREIRRE
jgi:hypothetical protein